MFTLQVRHPESAAGRIWNLAQTVCHAASAVLIMLKLAGPVTWSWWWVLSPLWLSGFLLAATLCVAFALFLLNLRGKVGTRR